MKYLLYTDLAAYDERRVEQLLTTLPPTEAQRIRRTSHFVGRREKVIAYQLLTDCLREEGLLRELPLLVYDSQGKPRLSNYPEVHFNMSHCRNAVAVAVADREVGVDVESVRTYKEPLAERVFGQREMDILRLADDKDRVFSRLWTRKEAVVKCLGTGIVGMEPLQGIDVSDDTVSVSTEGCPAAISPCLQSCLLRLTTMPLPDDTGYLSLCQPA